MWKKSHCVNMLLELWDEKKEPWTTREGTDPNKNTSGVWNICVSSIVLQVFLQLKSHKKNVLLNVV